MRRRTTRWIPQPTPTLLALAVSVAALPGTAAAQGTSGGDIAEIIRVTVRPGHSYEFEEGVKRHMALNAEQGNPSAWFAWEIMTGDDAGSYYFATFGHSWADFDEETADPEAMERSLLDNIDPHVGHASPGFWRIRPDLSRGAVPEGPPTRFAQLYFFTPDFSGAQGVEEAIVRIGEAAESAAWSGPNWFTYELLNGGRLPQYVLVIPGESMADFAEPSPTMEEMLVAELGEEGTMALFQGFGAALGHEMSEMIAFRPDLSHIPGSTEGMDGM